MYYSGISYHDDRVLISTIKKGIRGVQLVETRIQEKTKEIAKYPRSKYSQLIRESKVFFQKLRLPSKNEKNILATLPFQMQHNLPFPVEQSILGYRKQESSSKAEIEVFAVEKRFVQEESPLKTIHFYTSWSLAIWEYVRWAKPKFQGDILLIQDNLCVWMHLSNAGVEAIFSIELEDENRLEKILKRKEKASGEKRPLLCLGPKRESVLAILSESAWISEEVEEKFVPSQALSIGAALHQMNKGVNFYAPEIAKSKQGNFTIFSSVALLFFSMVLVAMTWLYSNRVEKDLSIKLKKIHYSLFESEPRKESNLAVYQKIQKELHKLKKIPIFSKKQTVLEALSFLKHETGFSEQFVLKRLNFDRESFPTIENPSAANRIKMELVVSAEDVIELEKWILNLQSNKNWVDSKKGVEYQRRGNEYVVTFYLQ